MKAEKEEITCLRDVAGKRSVKTLVQESVKGIKNKSQVQEPLGLGALERNDSGWMD